MVDGTGWMVMGSLTPLQIRSLKEPGRYSDGDGLYLELTGPNKGNWQFRATINGRRREIGLGSLTLVSLKVHAEQKASWKNGKHQVQWITTLEKYAFPLLGGGAW